MAHRSTAVAAAAAMEAACSDDDGSGPSRWPLLRRQHAAAAAATINQQQQQHEHQPQQQQQHQHQPRPRPQPPTVHLSWLLQSRDRAREAEFWASEDVRRSLARADMCGLIITIANIARLLRLQWIWLGHASPLHMAALGVLMAAAVAQVWALLASWPSYARHRHSIALAQRVARIVVCFGAACRNRGDASTTLLWLTNVASHGPAIVLAAFLAIMPLMQLQFSALFAVSTAAAAALSLWSVLVAGAMSLSTPARLVASADPAAVALGMRACEGIRGAWELALYVVVDQAAMPGVPAAGHRAFGLPYPCDHEETALMALLLFANLMLALLVPLFVSHALELGTKRAFWAARGVRVVADRSPLLPLPKHPFLSRALVLTAWPALLWAVAEQAAPYAVRLREWLYP